MGNKYKFSTGKSICKINRFYGILVILMIEELRRFTLVAKNGNLTKTAKEVFITQSALTQSISRLEKVLNTKLFVHQGRSLQLTPDGASVLLLSEKILTLWKNAKNPKVRKTLKPTYTIGMFDNAALRLGNYFKKNINNSNYDFELIIDNSGKLFEQLKLGTIDIAVCVNDQKENFDKNISLIKAFSETLTPVSSIVFKKRLKEIPFILYNQSSRTRQQTDTIFTKKGIDPLVFAESTSPSFMKELAILGCGVALLPENFVRAEIKQKILKIQQLPVKFNREYGVYINQSGNLAGNHPLVLEIINTLSKK